MAQTETGAHRGDASPSRELGEWRRGGWLEPGWGLRGGSSPRAAGKGMAPGNGQLPGKPEENCTNCLLFPLFATSGPGRQHRKSEGEGLGPLWMTGKGERSSPVGLGMGEGRWAKDDGFQLSLFLSSTIPFAVTPLLYYPSSLFAPLASLLFVSFFIVSFLHFPLLSW